jgi:hypothetical protein
VVGDQLPLLTRLGIELTRIDTPMSRSSAAALEVLEADYTSAFTEQLGGQRPLLLLEAPPVSDCGGAMNSKPVMRTLYSDRPQRRK